MMSSCSVGLLSLIISSVGKKTKVMRLQLGKLKSIGNLGQSADFTPKLILDL